MFLTTPGKPVKGLNIPFSPLQFLPHSQKHEAKQKNGSKKISPFLRVSCTSLHKEQPQSTDEDVSVICEPCNGKGWVLCSFCQGKRTNVKSKTNRIYRRCPTCKAVGYILCSKCKVYKCVTFPDFSDGQL